MMMYITNDTSLAERDFHVLNTCGTKEIVPSRAAVKPITFILFNSRV